MRRLHIHYSLIWLFLLLCSNCEVHDDVCRCLFFSFPSSFKKVKMVQLLKHRRTLVSVSDPSKLRRGGTYDITTVNNGEPFFARFISCIQTRFVEAISISM